MVRDEVGVRVEVRVRVRVGGRVSSTCGSHRHSTPLPLKSCPLRLTSSGVGALLSAC